MERNVEENKRKVNQALNEKNIDTAINTNWPFLVPFMKFLTQYNIVTEFMKISGTHIRKMISIHIFALLYVIKIIVGIPTIRGSNKLLEDLGAMRLVGLNMDMVFNGLCNRGSANQHGKEFKKKLLVL
jgi:hypothetical protein